jgi:hypothetical protein
MTITVKQLRMMKACDSQVELFKQTFGESVELTRELVLAHASKFDLHWFACDYLKGNKLEAYQKARASALEAYYREIASVWDAYNRETVSAWEACQKEIALAREAWQKERSLAREACQKAIDSAWEACHEAIAIIFCDVLEIE